MYLRYGVLALLVSLMAVALAACGGGTAVPTATTAPVATTTSTGPADYTIQLKNAGGGKYAYEPATLALTAGQTYTIQLKADAEFHTWSVEKTPGVYFAGADIQVLPNETKTVQFTAPAEGTYKVVCIPHQTLGMVGTLTTK